MFLVLADLSSLDKDMIEREDQKDGLISGNTIFMQHPSNINAMSWCCIDVAGTWHKIMLPLNIGWKFLYTYSTMTLLPSTVSFYKIFVVLTVNALKSKS